MIDNKTYWEDFYRKNEVTREPSSFALFCRGFMDVGNTVLDLGCGNGRDALYFNHEGMIVTALDIIDIELNKDIDFVQYDLQKQKPFFGLDEIFDFVYCRFMLHAIPQELEEYILWESWNVLKNKGVLCIEARSDKGKVLKDDHFRRLINIVDLLINLSDYEIIYKTEQQGLSVYNNEDPILIRIICRKWMKEDAGL